MTQSNAYTIGDHDTRPWGEWTVLDAGPRYVVKRILVNPGQRLSLQYHHHRSERWTCVSGVGVAEIAGVDHPFAFGQTVDIPVTAHHRVRCTGDQPLVFVEIQYGDVLDENDIVRVSDDYNRA